ncbi:MAG: hypothetical protein K0R55_255 [Sporomusa sp.]|jgi:hypothetical protein|nr:hypothetical protein [Sporomusa sp.]
MALNISRGVIFKAQKVVCYGPEGIGKSTFASQFPDPLFIDTEGSTNSMNVARLPRPTSWTMLLSMVKEVKATPSCCKTLIIDTIDWAEQLCVEHVCAVYNKKGIEDFGYGNGYVYVKEEFGRLLNLLSDVIDCRINVVLTAHAQIKKFEQPDECGSYDRYELKLGKKTASQTSPLVKEWADMVLFANYKVHVVEVDKKKKSSGGARVMYTTHHPCWDAKNRHDLKAELPFEYMQIAYCIPNHSDKEPELVTRPEEKPAVSQKQETQRKEIAAEDRYFYHPESDSYWMVKKGKELPTDMDAQLSAELDKGEWEERKKKHEAIVLQTEKNKIKPDMGDTTGLPKSLTDLMTANQVTVEEIQNVVSMKGYYPQDTPLKNYDQGFIDGVLVGAWDQVFAMINEARSIPFK